MTPYAIAEAMRLRRRADDVAETLTRLRFRLAAAGHHETRRQLRLRLRIMGRAWLDLRAEALALESDGAPLSSNAAAYLLGLDPSTVRRLIATGTLPAMRVGRHYRIARTALYDLVTRREMWLLIPPASLPDADLRQAAEAAQRTAGGRWWGVAELAARDGVTEDAIHWRRKAGWGGDGWAQHGTYWHLWTAEVPAARARGHTARQRVYGAAQEGMG